METINLDSILTKSYEHNIDDVFGLVQAKSSLTELASSNESQSILIHGGAGLGKTMLVKAICASVSANVFFLNMANLITRSASSSQLLCQMFDQITAKQSSLVVLDDLETLFIDDSSPRSTIVRELIDNFTKILRDSRVRIMLIGVTNRPWILTDGFIKLFNIGLHLNEPNHQDRIEILKRNLNEYSLGANDWNQLALLTSGFSGADLTSLTRDIKMEPVRSLIKSTHFRKIHTDDGLKYTPCNPDEADSIRLNIESVDENEIFLKNLTLDEMFKLAKNHAPSIDQQYLEHFSKFQNKYF